jgi:hypothetical protein
VSAAEPIAKPLPIAAVVLPSASRPSVILRTSGPSPLISLIPPALSAIGPYASTDIVIPTVASIPTAAMAMPYRPAAAWATKIAAQMTSMGAMVLRMPTASPAMILVAGPVRAASAMVRTGEADV